MKKILSVLMALCMAVGLVACGTAPSNSSSNSQQETVQSSSQEDEKLTFRIAAMKGPTAMGIAKLMDESKWNRTPDSYQVKIYATAQEIVPQIVQDEIDVALLPANVASNLYHQTEGKVQVAAINTLGVLYMVENGDTIHSVADLKGKTIYSTGKNNTPEYVLNYILTQNGINPQTDVTIEYKSEATEVAALMAEEGNEAIAVLPQPYVAIAQSQNENLRVALDLTKEWDSVSPDSSLITGVLVVNREFAQQNAKEFELFLKNYKESIEFAHKVPAEVAKLSAHYEIVPKAGIALKALPQCNLIYIDGDEMKTRLSGYLKVLMEQNEKSIGGSMPKDDFYYGAK